MIKTSLQIVLIMFVIMIFCGLAVPWVGELAMWSAYHARNFFRGM